MTPGVLAGDRPPSDVIQAGDWAEVNTLGGCLKVHISYEPDSLAIDCLPYKTLVFVDDAQMIGPTRVVHLAGRGYVFPEGLTVTTNPAEHTLPPVERPHDVGSIAFTVPDGNVWTLHADGSYPAQITGGPGQPAGAFYSSLAWSPDGRKLLLRRETDTGRDVQLYDADGGLRTLYPRPGSQGSANPGVVAWASDNLHALLVDYDQGGNACERPSNQYSIRSVDVDTGSLVDLLSATTKGFVAALSASPDGRSVAVLFGASCDAVTFNICLLALAADPAYGVRAGQLRCPPGAMGGEVAWSPDGRYLAYTSRLQGRGDESALSTGLPLELMDARGAFYYPIVWPLGGDRNIIGVSWTASGGTVRVEDEVPRGLTDTSLPARTIRRIAIDGSGLAVVEVGANRLLDVRPTLAPETVHGDYALAMGPKGELWVVGLGQQDARWRLTDAAVLTVAWSP